MGAIQLFHATLDGARKLDEKPFYYEKDLQGFIEKRLLDLFKIDFLATEYITSSQDKRIDTLGIDNKGRPVVIEYKLLGDKNIINQGLRYLNWLRKSPDSIELLVIKKFGQDRAKRVDLKNPRLLCIAGKFTENDTAAAENFKADVELVRYCRYGDSSLILEWVYGGESLQSKSGDKARRTPSDPPHRDVSPNFSVHKGWDRSDVELQKFFMKLHAHIVAFGKDVKVVAVENYISFKRKRNIADVKLKSRNKELTVYALLDPDSVQLQEGFTRDVREIGHHSPNHLEITIRNLDDLERAKPLLQRSYEEAG